MGAAVKEGYLIPVNPSTFAKLALVNPHIEMCRLFCIFSIIFKYHRHALENISLSAHAKPEILVVALRIKDYLFYSF